MVVRLDRGEGSPEGIEVSTPLLLGQKDGDDDDAKYPRVSAGITLFTAFVGTSLRNTGGGWRAGQEGSLFDGDALGVGEVRYLSLLSVYPSHLSQQQRMRTVLSAEPARDRLSHNTAPRPAHVATDVRQRRHLPPPCRRHIP